MHVNVCGLADIKGETWTEMRTYGWIVFSVLWFCQRNTPTKCLQIPMHLPIMNNDNEQSCSAYLVDVQYHTKENLSRACSDIFEDLLRKSYDLDEPTLPDKCSIESQTGPSELQIKKRNFLSEYDCLSPEASLTYVSSCDVLVCYGVVKIDIIPLIRITIPKTTCLKDALTSLKIYWKSHTVSKNPQRNCQQNTALWRKLTKLKRQYCHHRMELQSTSIESSNIINCNDKKGSLTFVFQKIVEGNLPRKTASCFRCVGFSARVPLSFHR